MTRAPAENTQILRANPPGKKGFDYTERQAEEDDRCKVSVRLVILQLRMQQKKNTKSPLRKSRGSGETGENASDGSAARCSGCHAPAGSHFHPAAESRRWGYILSRRRGKLHRQNPPERSRFAARTHAHAHARTGFSPAQFTPRSARPQSAAPLHFPPPAGYFPVRVCVCFFSFFLLFKPRSRSAASPVPLAGV